MGRRIAIGVLLATVVALVPAGAGGHTGGVSLSGKGAATIDGNVSAGEWAHAAALPFDANVPGGGTAPAVFRVMNDATTLYLSLTVQHVGPQQTFAVAFDNDHDASNGPEEGDDGLSFGFGVGGPGLNDNVRTTRPPCPSGSMCAFHDLEVGGTLDGLAAQSTVGNATHFELSHPLNSADDLNDFSLGIGDTVGFGFQYVVEGIFTVPAQFSPMISDIVVAEPLPTLSIGNAGVFEGNVGTTDATFTVSLSSASPSTVTAWYGTSNGSATAPSDYAASVAAVTFAPGEVSQQLTVPVFGDTEEEATESFFVNLYYATNATIADGQGVGTISDDDVPAGNHTLAVLKGGTGFGSVTGTGITCGADCFQSYPPSTAVTLTATAGHGSVLDGWSGCDAPSGTTCTMTMNAPKAVVATFTATPTFTDVPPTNPFYEQIEHLFDLGITTGCNPPAQRHVLPGRLRAPPADGRLPDPREGADATVPGNALVRGRARLEPLLRLHRAAQGAGHHDRLQPARERPLLPRRLRPPPADGRLPDPRQGADAALPGRRRPSRTCPPRTRSSATSNGSSSRGSRPAATRPPTTCTARSTTSPASRWPPSSSARSRPDAATRPARWAVQPIDIARRRPETRATAEKSANAAFRRGSMISRPNRSGRSRPVSGSARRSLTKPSVAAVASALSMLFVIGGTEASAIPPRATTPNAVPAAFPGSNGKIAFSSARDGDSEIFVMDADGTHVEQLTHNTFIDITPRWSANGTKIAWTRRGATDPGVYTMTANGSNQTLVTSGRSGSWSPDGTRLVLEKPVGLGLLLFQFPGTVTVLNGHEDTEPVFSPDGTKIAVRRGEPSDEIVVLDAAGQGGLVLSEGNGANRDPDWSPDGLRIAYGKAAAGTVVIVPAVGGPRQIFGAGADPAWSPDGTMLAFETPLGQIAKRRADGTGPTTNLTEGQDPEWQPAPPELRALEVNQSVQTWTNAIPLVTDKETGVRAFVQMTGGPQEITVKGKLAGVRDGAPLPGSPLTAINPGGKVKVKQDIVARRGTLADSLNFQLPLSWRHGTVKLRLESDVVCSEPAGPGADPATDCAVTVTFANQTRPSIVYIPIKYGAAVSPSFPQLREQMLRSRSILPTPAITYAYDSLAAFPSAVAPTEDAVNAALETKWVYDTSGACIGPTCRSAAYVYYGVIVGDGGGLATGIPGHAASGFLSGTGARNETGYQRNRGPHEQAHLAGRHHAVDDALGVIGGLKQGWCKEVADPAAPPHTPFELVDGEVMPVLGPLSDGPDKEVWGLDTRFLSSDPSSLPWSTRTRRSS